MEPWEVVESDYIRRFFNHFQIDCVFDVGANRGQYARLLRNAVGYQGLILSFEPNPEAFLELLSISRDDGLWSVFPLALSDCEELVSFNQMTSDQFSSLQRPSSREVQLFTELNQIRQTFKVFTATLDKIIDFIGRDYQFSQPYLKIDTQGSDLNVIQGAGEKLQIFAGIQSELSLRRIYENAPKFNELIEYLETKNFYPTAIFPNNSGHWPQLIEMDCIFHRAS